MSNMSDIRLNTAHNVNNDAKNRNLIDAVAAEMSNSQFLDVMMARITAIHSDDAELNALVKKVDSNKGADKADNKALLNRLKDLQDDKSAQQADGPISKAEIRQKVKERIQKIAENHTTAIDDTRALKTLQKTAHTLIEAHEQGDITLPPMIVQKLQDFLDKGDDFKAFDMANFMTEFNALFRNAILVMPQDQSTEFQWPAEISALFEELKLPAPSTDMMGVMRALKALVNASQNAAIATLDSHAQDNLGNTDINANPNEQDALAALLNDTLPQAETQDAASLPDPLQEALQNTAAQQEKSAQEKQATNITAPNIFAGSKKEQADQDGFSLTDMAKNSAFPEREQRLKGDGTARDQSAKQQAGTKNNAAIQAQGQLAGEVKAAFNPVSVSAPSAGALQAAAIDPTMIGLDQSSVSPATATRIAFNAELQAAARAERPHPAAQQVIMQIAQKANGKATQISVQLSPAELGRVEVRMTIQRDGQAHAVIVADKPETLALLQRDASHLERALQQAGINANAGNMSFNLRDEQQAQQSGDGKKRFSRSKIGETQAVDQTMTIQHQAIISDTRINYHA